MKLYSRIQIHNSLGTFNSNWEPTTKEQLIELTESFKDLFSEPFGSINMQIGESTVIIPEDILKSSILTIETKEV